MAMAGEVRALEMCLFRGSTRLTLEDQRSKRLGERGHFATSELVFKWQILNSRRFAADVAACVSYSRARAALCMLWQPRDEIINQ